MGFVKGIVGADHRGITYEPTPLGGTTVTSCAAADRSRANALFSLPSQPPMIRAAHEVPGKELQPDEEAGDFFAVCKTAD